MATRSQETLDRLEHEARQARATVSSQLAQVRHRLEPQVLKSQAEEMKDQLIEQARDKSSQYVEERKHRLKQTLRELETEQRRVEAELKNFRQKEIQTKREIEALSVLIDISENRTRPKTDQGSTEPSD